jgi:hypothetical protein
MAVQIDDENFPARNAAQLSQENHHMVVFEVVHQERAD